MTPKYLVPLTVAFVLRLHSIDSTDHSKASSLKSKRSTLHSKVKDDWESQHSWQPTLEESYCEVFATNCAKYPHYFDAVQNSFGELEDEFPTMASDP